MTEDPPPVTVSFRFPVASAPIPIRLAAALAPLPLPAVAADPDLVAPDTADVEVAEPQLPEGRQLPTQDVRFTNDDILQTDELPYFIPSDSSDSSADATEENSVYLSNFPFANISESPQAQSSSANLPNSFDPKLRLLPRDYHEKAIQNKLPPKVRCIPVSEPAASSYQLTLSQKLDLIVDSCQRTRTFKIVLMYIQTDMYTIRIPL